MNNRVQQRFDRSIREATASVAAIKARVNREATAAKAAREVTQLPAWRALLAKGTLGREDAATLRTMIQLAEQRAALARAQEGA